MSTISEREQKILGIIETARGKRPKFRDEQINMAHGAGGKATQTLIEGLLVPALGGAGTGGGAGTSSGAALGSAAVGNGAIVGAAVEASRPLIDRMGH